MAAMDFAGSAQAAGAYGEETVIALDAAASVLGRALDALALAPVRASDPAQAAAQLISSGTAALVIVDAAQAGEWLTRRDRLDPARRGRTVVVVAPEDADMAFLALERGASDVVAVDADAEELRSALFGRDPKRAAESGLGAMPTLADLSSEVARIARALDGLAKGEAARPGDVQPVAPPATDAARVRAIIRARRARESFFPSDLFADPAWDILLDLMAARIEGKPVSVSSLCIAAAVPPTTALRWIRTLTDAGMLVREPDPQDGRRVYVGLSDRAADAMQAYLAQAARMGTAV